MAKKGHDKIELIGEKMRVACIEASISIGYLSDSLNELFENSLMQEVNDIINK